MRDKINTAAPTGVTADVITSNQGGLDRFQLEISGTTTFADGSGVLTSMGILDSDGVTADGITSGVETDQFRSTTTSIGSLLGLSGAQSGTVVVGGQNVDIDLAEDSLADIQAKIDAAGLTGVTTSIVSSTDEDDNSLFAPRVGGTSDFIDDNNVLETAGIVIGSNSAFESVARVLTSNGTNLAKGAVKNAITDGAKSDLQSSDVDTIETLSGSSAAGTVTIGDQTVAVDFTTDTLADIRDNINAAAPTGVTASINVIGPTEFELQIDGTTEFSDDGGVLQALGLLAAPTTLTADTRLADVLDAGVQVGDTISISGVDHDGDQVSGNFTISSANLKVSNLLSSIEQTFGNAVTASVDASGRIVLADDEAGSSSISLTLQANNEGGRKPEPGRAVSDHAGHRSEIVGTAIGSRLFVQRQRHNLESRDQHHHRRSAGHHPRPERGRGRQQRRDQCHQRRYHRAAGKHHSVRLRLQFGDGPDRSTVRRRRSDPTRRTAGRRFPPSSRCNRG